MMASLFGTQYFGFIASAYGITLAVLCIMTVAIVMTYRARRRKLDELEKAGHRRTSRTDG